MAVNKLSSKLSLSAGLSSNNGDTILNKEHPVIAAASTSSDIEWQWTSPIGVSNVKIRMGKSPLQQMKKPCESISPVFNNFPRKRKLIKNEEIEIEFGSSVRPDALHYAPMCDPTINTELAEKSAFEGGGPQSSKEDYCALFDDGEDAMDECLMQLSQTVEQDLSRNLNGIVPLEVTTPRSTRVHSALTKTSAFSLNLSKAAMKQCSPIVQNSIPRVETKVGAGNQCPPSSLPPLRQGTNVSSYGASHHRSQGVYAHIAIQETLQDAPPAPCENTTKYDINDSFDDILVTFCEENIELLTQPINEKHIPNKTHRTGSLLNTVPNLQTSSRAGETKAFESRRPIVSTRQVPQQGAIKSSNSVSFPVPKYDDDFLQPDLLKLLETVEANSQQPASQILRCTPEEIEKKRREAKLKLERKKIALKSGLVRI